MRHIHRASFCLLSVFLLTACDPSDLDGEGGNPLPDSAGDGDAGVPMPTDIVFRGRCAQDERLGGFEAIVLPDYSSVQGSVASGVVPSSVRTIALEGGGCTVWQKPTLDCNPTCSVEETCDFDETCIPFPFNQNLETVTVDGLNTEIAMAPREPGNQYFDTDVPHPVFDVNNQTVRLMATGGFLNEKTLYGAGSKAIAPGNNELIITPGQYLTVEWDAPTADTPTHVVLELTIDQHGNTPASLECEFEDTGEGVVPAAVVDALMDAGVTGYPNGRLARGTVDSVRGEEGCVEFAVKSYKPVEISVAGFIPCSGPGTCQDGRTCNSETFICE